jgi:hypothetical protein
MAEAACPGQVFRDEAVKKGQRPNIVQVQVIAALSARGLHKEAPVIKKHQFINIRINAIGLQKGVQPGLGVQGVPDKVLPCPFLPGYRLGHRRVVGAHHSQGKEVRQILRYLNPYRLQVRPVQPFPFLGYRIQEIQIQKHVPDYTYNQYIDNHGENNFETQGLVSKHPFILRRENKAPEFKKTVPRKELRLLSLRILYYGLLMLLMKKFAPLFILEYCTTDSEKSAF